MRGKTYIELGALLRHDIVSPHSTSVVQGSVPEAHVYRYPTTEERQRRSWVFVATQTMRAGGTRIMPWLCPFYDYHLFCAVLAVGGLVGTSFGGVRPLVAVAGGPVFCCVEVLCFGVLSV